MKKYSQQQHYKAKLTQNHANRQIQQMQSSGHNFTLALGTPPDELHEPISMSAMLMQTQEKFCSTLVELTQGFSHSTENSTRYSIDRVLL